MAGFGGWLMPIEYPGGAGVERRGGVVREHLCVRETVGVFDVSHLGKVRVSGPGAAAYLNRCLTNDLDKIGPGRAQYTLCCTSPGGVIDDLIAYLISDEEVLLVPNAANAADVVSRLTRGAPTGVVVHDAHTEYGVLAVQGPASAPVLAAVLDDASVVGELGYMSFRHAVVNPGPQVPGGPIPVTVCRTGYTGELGFELVTPWERTGQVWDVLLPAVLDHDGLPAGLGARDTLRTEMGYPLHGHELSESITPVHAGVGWAVGWSKPQFWGREALVALKAAGPEQRVRGLLVTGRGIPRPGCPVLRKPASELADGADPATGGVQIGEVTSGTFSPTLGTGIALALLDQAAGLTPGDPVVIDVRGRPVEAQVTTPPFVRPGVKG